MKKFLPILSIILALFAGNLMAQGVAGEQPGALQYAQATGDDNKSADETKEYLDMGVRHFSVGTDITILHGYWKREGEQVVRALEGE